MILLNLPRPPSVNSLYRNVRGKGRVRTERYKTWLRAAGNELIGQSQNHMAGPVEVFMWLGRDINKDGSSSRRRIDLDNFAKATLDLLTKHHLIDDDAFVEEIRLRWTTDIKPRRMQVNVQPAAVIAQRKAA